MQGVHTHTHARVRTCSPAAASTPTQAAARVQRLAELLSTPVTLRWLRNKQVAGINHPAVISSAADLRPQVSYLHSALFHRASMWDKDMHARRVASLSPFPR